MSCINSRRCIGIVQCPSQRCVKHEHASGRSVSALFHDTRRTVTQVDSRFWQTMYTLLLRPGSLTPEYLAERRACYLPPVRVDLVLSELFFAFGSGGPRGRFETGATVPNAHSSAVVASRLQNSRSWPLHTCYFSASRCARRSSSVPSSHDSMSAASVTHRPWRTRHSTRGALAVREC